MNFNFGEVLTRAWEIVWKHRVLWIFGILASCGRGGGGNGGGSGSGGNGGGSGVDLPPEVLQVLQWIEQNLTMFFILLCVVVLLIALITLAISTVGKIGLIRGTAQVEGGEQSLIFGQLFSEGMPYFGRVFGLSVLLVLPAFVFAMIVLLMVVPGALAAGGDPTALFATAPLLICCVCLFIPLMFVLGMIFQQAERAVVLDDMAVVPALSQGWDIFKKNLGPIILMAIILAVIGFGVGLVIALPIFIIVFPAAFAYAIGNAQTNTPLYLGAVCFCLYLPVLLVLNGILVAYTESAWTLTYMRLTRKPDAGNRFPTDNFPPAGPEENKTLITSEPKDNDRTVIAKKPDA